MITHLQSLLTGQLEAEMFSGFEQSGQSFTFHIHEVVTDQWSGAGIVDAGPRSCGVRVGEQPVDLTQRHAASAIAHLTKNRKCEP